jgi:hypothetical protein
MASVESVDEQLTTAQQKLHAALWLGHYAVVAVVEREIDRLLDLRNATRPAVMS